MPAARTESLRRPSHRARFHRDRAHRDRRAPVPSAALDVALLAVLAAAMRLPATLASRHVGYDDGVFGLSALVLRTGARPFRDVWSPQGPLHLVLLQVADEIGLRSSVAPRLLPLAAGIVTTTAVYCAGRRLGSRAGALLAAVLVAGSGSLLWTTGPITADGPATAFVAAALAVALGTRHARTPRDEAWRALLAGTLLGAGIAVKLLVAPAALALGVALGTAPPGTRSRLRWRALGAAGAGALLVPAVTTLVFGPSRVWDQSVRYHRRAPRGASVADQAWKVLRTLWERDLPLVVVAVAVLVTVLLGRRDRAVGAPRDGRAVAALLLPWGLVTAGLLAAEPNLFRNHLAALVVPLALLVAWRPPPLRLALVAVLLATPTWLANTHGVLWPGPAPRAERRAVTALTALPAGAQAISDEPGLVWRARRRSPGDLVDASAKRIAEGRITAASLADAAADRRVCAVLVWSSRYRDLALGPRLADVGYRASRRFGDGRVLYEKLRCRPGR